MTDDAPELLIEYTYVCAVCPNPCRVMTVCAVPPPACIYPWVETPRPAWETESRSYL